jgi:predicted nucleic acid-binding protein
MIGPVRQELLSGIREHSQFKRLREDLRAFKDAEIGTADYESAAEMSNQCRSQGVAASSVDMLICAIAVRVNCAIFTTDHDYLRYSKILGLHLFGMKG